MAMITYPLDNIDYSAADAGLFHCTRKSGVWAEDSFPISASGGDNSITIGSGVAWISNDKYWGKVVAQKEAVTLDLGLADPVYNRIDAVVIQFDSNANATDIVVKKGTPATKPSMPEIVQNESIFELCLCKVLRPAGSSVVTFTNIADTRLDPTICGLMADSVTKIDTKAINAQVQALILSLTEEIESVKDKSGLMHTSDWVEDGVIPIDKGGTDANTPEEALANLGGISKTLLWENPSPTSLFPNQSILIDLNNYDEVEIECLADTSFVQRFTENFRVGIDGILSTLKFIHADNNAIYRGNIGGHIRTCTISPTGIYFSGSTLAHATDYNGTNTGCIPCRIYGIKGVQ